jgi:TonB-dependent SusC/RagA subfamily outer membrane receptor
MGVVRPEIVVPRWLLHRTDDEQRLAVAHEEEHLRARDPILLCAGWAAIILTPWNAALWYMVSRLRLAIELDCDARVLRRGVMARAYGSLLIEVAQNASPLTLSALGFADESSQLYQRILALRAPTGSFARTRAAFAVAAAVTGVLVACRVAPPRSASQPAPSVRVANAPTAAPAPVAAEVARASSVDDSMAPKRRAPRAHAVAVAPTPPVAEAPASEPVSPAAAPVPRSDSTPVLVHLESVARIGPLILIDGARSSMDEMRAMDPNTIANVEVLKGAAAIATYGADAERGVITVTTFKTSSPPR